MIVIGLFWFYLLESIGVVILINLMDVGFLMLVMIVIIWVLVVSLISINGFGLFVGLIIGLVVGIWFIKW